LPEVVRYALVALVVLFTHFQEGVTGFGCTVLALPFIVLLIGLETAVPVLAIQAWLLALGIVTESRKRIVWREYGIIVLLTGAGLPLGMWMASSLPEARLKWVLAAFMLVVGAQGLWKHTRKVVQNDKGSPRARFLAALALPLGGVIHGAFASGGPLVVIYATRALVDKSLFRVTLCLLWLTLNTVMIGQWLRSGALDAHILRVTAFCVPFTLAGMVLGNRAHYRINEVRFRQVVYGVLLLSGVVLIWSLIG